MTSDGTTTFTYDDAGRMVSSTRASLTTTYLYNALGQRVKKSRGADATYFVYDEAGRLIGEYDSAGELVQEIVWMNDIPVLSIRWSSCGMAVFYIHTDHLNTPRRITKRSSPDIVWRWDSDPFGTTAANEDPDANSATFAFNMRFPGQYFDQETGLYYNYLRDYDPNTGRYIQSDPIGLRAGVNTYAYVGANPIRLIDPFGLQGFDPGRWPADPTPDNRDQRTPWQPPGVSNRDLCDPYWRVTVEFNGQQNSGLIPLVSEEVVSEDECHKTVLCTYTGRVFVNVRWGEASADSREMVVTKFKTRKK